MLEAFPLVTQKVFFGYMAILKGDLHCIACPHPELVLFLGYRETGRVGLDDHRADAVSALSLLVGNADGDEDAAVLAVGDEGLGAVDDVVLTFIFGVGEHACGVAAAAGLGQAPRAEHLTLRERRQIFALLLLAPEDVDVVCAQRVVRRNA